jgi:hypothetical protein
MFIVDIKNCVEDLWQMKVNSFCQNKPMITDRLMKQQLMIFMCSLHEHCWSWSGQLTGQTMTNNAATTKLQQQNQRLLMQL